MLEVIMMMQVANGLLAMVLLTVLVGMIQRMRRWERVYERIQSRIDLVLESIQSVPGNDTATGRISEARASVSVTRANERGVFSSTRD